VNFLLHLRQEWEVISKTPFACLICVVIGFAIGSWYYAEQVATLNSQVAFWKDKATAPGSASAAGAVPGSAGAPAGKSAHFTMNAAGVNFFTSPGDGSLTGIVLDVDIRNSGMPSIATGWKLDVTPRGQSPAAAQYEAIPAAPLEVGNPPFTVRAKEGLADKVVKKPIPYEKVVSGRLLFYVRLPLAVVQDQSTRLTLKVQDIAGNVFSTSDLVGDWLRPHGNSVN
jgi:hypothetical protein